MKSRQQSLREIAGEEGIIYFFSNLAEFARANNNYGYQLITRIVPPNNGEKTLELFDHTRWMNISKNWEYYESSKIEFLVATSLMGTPLKFDLDVDCSFLLELD
jgi:hypothetical protein